MGPDSLEVYCTNTVEGIHRWKDAPKEVAFLRNPHRHLFNIKTYVRVGHDDRDVEFIMLKGMVDRYMLLKPIQETESCEQIAKRLRNYLTKQYHLTVTQIEVNEDGENGAIAKWESEARDGVHDQ